MSVTTEQRAAELFKAALDVHPARRATYLQHRCAGDAALLARVERLLALDSKGETFLRPPGGAIGAETLEAPQRPTGDEPNAESLGSAGRRIGPYRLLDRLGEGGCGTVYLAVQDEPVRRRVALKVIKLGMDTRQVIARFEAERQALALMDHPNIARVLDAGSTEGGRPYFVMELIRGVPITEYCDAQRVPLRRRIELVLSVCAAVQHAHQKGVIHRDLKPSNILVTMAEGVTPAQAPAPLVKVIDFGVAKAIEQPLTERTLLTAQHQPIGTPEYMSPEQADPGALDIDTRSDVYSLGVVLYELLSGTLPIARTAQGLIELYRRIREEEPVPPSRRLMERPPTGGGAPQGADLAGWRRELSNDLDWIVMKALEKDRRRRYATTSELAQDLQRYLAGQPTVARPPSVRYRVGKFVGRNRGPVAVGALLALALAAGFSATAYSLVSVRRANSDLKTQTTIAGTALKTAEERGAQLAAALRDVREAESHAHQESEDAAAAREFMDNVLASVNPEGGRADVSMREVLDLAARKLDEAWFDRPLVAAFARNTIGRAYHGLGNFGAAERQLAAALEVRRRELGVGHRDTLTSINNLGALWRDQGRAAEAETLLREGLAAARGLLGADDELTLRLLSNLATTLQDQRKLGEALDAKLAVLDASVRSRGQRSRETVLAMNNLATALIQQRRFDDAQRMVDGALALAADVLEEHDALRCETLRNLAALRSRQGRPADAARAVREALAIYAASRPGNHPDVLSARADLARVLWDSGRTREAARMLEKLLPELDRSAEFGRGHAITLAARLDLASIRIEQGRLDEAGAMVADAGEQSRVLFAPENRIALYALYVEAQYELARGAPDAAEPLALRALRMRCEQLGNEHPDSLRSMSQAGRVLAARGRAAEGAELCRAAWEGASAALDPRHWLTWSLASDYAFVLGQAGRIAESRAGQCAALVELGAALGDDHPLTRRAAQRLAHPGGVCDEPQPGESVTDDGPLTDGEFQPV